MSSEVIGFPCVGGGFGTCSATTVRSVLSQHRRDRDAELTASFTLRLLCEDNEYDARIGLEGDAAGGEDAARQEKPPCYVTLLQMAAIVNRSKRTLGAAGK